MARLAPLQPVVVDVTELGALEDRRPVPLPPPTPWAPGDEPLWESVDLNELPNEVLKFKVCRSFRADLRHKLVLIIRAQGGYQKAGSEGAAKRLQVHRSTLFRWLRWHTCPQWRHMHERIDSAYEEAVQILVAKKMAGTKKKTRRKRNAKSLSTSPPVC